MAKLRFGRQPTRDRHLPAAAAGLAVAALLTLVWYSSVPQQGAATATAITARLGALSSSLWGNATSNATSSAGGAAGSAATSTGADLSLPRNQWKTTLEFLHHCSNFLPEGPPEGHPSKLSELVGAKAPAELNLAETVRLMQEAADFAWQLANKTIELPPANDCINDAAVVVGAPASPGQLRIGVVITNSSSDSISDRSLTQKREYCERHGYTLHVFDNGIAAPRHVYLGSTLATMAVLRLYDWVFKIDLDTIIMSPSLRIERFLDPRFDVVISEDCHGINAGMYFIRNTAWSHTFLLEIFGNPGKTPEHYDIWGDNAVIIEMAKDQRIRNHVKVVSQDLFNKYPHPETQCKGVYAEGDFLLHFAGAKPERKAQLFNEYWEKRQHR